MWERTKLASAQQCFGEVSPFHADRTAKPGDGIDDQSHSENGVHVRSHLALGDGRIGGQLLFLEISTPRHRKSGWIVDNLLLYAMNGRRVRSGAHQFRIAMCFS